MNQSRPFCGPELIPVHLPNHVPDEFKSWVTGDEVQTMVDKECMARWADYPDVSVHETPHMVLPLGVEKKKPRPTRDDRWLNLIYRHLLFTMDGVGEVARCAWKGAHQVTIDHKAGYHHVVLDTKAMALIWLRVGRRVLRFHRAGFRVMVLGNGEIRLLVRNGGTIPAFPRHSCSDVDR